MKATLDGIPRETILLQHRGRLLVAALRRKTPELTPGTVERTRTRLLDVRSSGFTSRRGRRSK